MSKVSSKTEKREKSSDRKEKKDKNNKNDKNELNEKKQSIICSVVKPIDLKNKKNSTNLKVKKNIKDEEGNINAHDVAYTDVSHYINVKNPKQVFKDMNYINNIKTPIESYKRTSLNFRIDSNEYSLEHLGKSLIVADKAVEKCKEQIFEGNEKAMDSYDFKSSITRSTPKYDANNPEKDLTPKDYARLNLSTRIERYYKGKVIEGEDLKNVREAENSYYKNDKATDQDNKKFNKKTVMITIDDDGEKKEEEIKLFKDIEKKRTITTEYFYREIDSSKVPFMKNEDGKNVKDDKGNNILMTPNLIYLKDSDGNKVKDENGDFIIDDGKVLEIYGRPEGKGKYIGSDSNFDELLSNDDGKDMVFMRMKCEHPSVYISSIKNELCVEHIVPAIDIIKIKGVYGGGMGSKMTTGFSDFIKSGYEYKENEIKNISVEKTEKKSYKDVISDSSKASSTKDVVEEEEKKENVNDDNKSKSSSGSNSDSDSDSDNEDDADTKSVSSIDSDKSKKSGKDVDVAISDSDSVDDKNKGKKVVDSSDSDSDSDSDSEDEKEKIRKDKEMKKQEELKKEEKENKKSDKKTKKEKK